MKKRFLLRLLPLSIFCFLGLSTTLLGQTITWLGGTGSWSDPTKWDTGQVPNTTDDVLISSGTVTVNTSNAVAERFTLSMGATLQITTSGVLTITALRPFLIVAGTISNAGTFNITGQFGASLQLGGTINNSGTFRYEITIPQTYQNYQAGISMQTVGLFNNQVGGTFTSIGLYKCFYAFGAGCSVINSGNFSIQMADAYNDPVFFSRTAGQVLEMYNGATYTGNANSSFVFNGGGTAVVGGGSFSNAGTVRIGNLSPTVGGIEASVVNTGTIEIDNLTMAGLYNSIEDNFGILGSITNQGTIKIGNNAPINGDGLHSDLTNTATGSIEINRTARTAFSSNGQTSSNHGSIKIGNVAEVGRAGFLMNQSLNAVFTNTGTFEVDAVPIRPTDFYNSAFMTRLGTTFSNQGILRIGTNTAVGNGLGNAFCYGGTISNSGTIILDKINYYGIHNNQLVVNEVGGTITVPTTGSCRVAGQLTNHGTLTNNGLMTVYINGISKFTNNGTFTNNGSLTNTASIGGTGIIVQNGTFSNGLYAHLRPGSSPGMLSITGNLDLGVSTFECEINGTTANTTYDVIAISGNVNISNATLEVIWGFTPVAGNSFTILTCGSRTGQFPNITIPAISGLNFSITYNSTSVIITAATALPVELISFSAKNREGGKTQLSWQTTNETNVKNFDIEKSADGQHFQNTHEIKAKNTPSVYSAIDDQFLSSAYYRLKINDLDGKVNYSKTIFVEKDGKGIKISRNTEGGIFIETDDRIEQVTLTNAVGQVIKTGQNNTVTLDNLPTGIYIVSVKTNRASISQKVFKS